MRAGVTNAECNAFRKHAFLLLGLRAFLAPVHTHKHYAFAMRDAELFDMVERALDLPAYTRRSAADVAMALKSYNAQHNLLASEEEVSQAVLMSRLLQPAVVKRCKELVGSSIGLMFSCMGTPFWRSCG
jgi:hypothetical protein